MNDQTPRRYQGSLLERAAARYDLMHEPRVIPPLPQEPAAQPEHRVQPQPEPAPVAVLDLAEAPRVETPAPVATPAAPVPGTRPRIAIDRARLAEEGMLVPGATVTALAEEFRLLKRQLLNTARAIHAPT